MKPALVLVHGAWHVPQHYEIFSAKLEAEGYEVYIPHLPSCGQLAAQSTLADDVKVVRQQLDDLLISSRQVLVIAHSYGGAVATQALSDDLICRQRRAGPPPGKVLHIIYMCAFMLQPGESCFAASQPRPDPDPVEPGDDGTSFLCQSGKALFYNDVNNEELVSRCEKLLVRHSLAALASPISHAAWQHFPATYIRCTKDRVLFVEWQDKLIQAVKDSGTELEVETYDAGHSPFLSKTRDMVAVVGRVAEMYVAQ